MSIFRFATLACLTLLVSIGGPRAHAEQPGNSISNVSVSRGSDGQWSVQLDYSLDGASPATALEVQVSRNNGAEDHDPMSRVAGTVVRPDPASHHFALPIRYEGEPDKELKVITLFKGRDGTVLARQDLFVTLDPTTGKTSPAIARPGPSKNERDLNQAIRLIDEAASPDDLKEPRRILEDVIARDARFDPAYVELARIAMKTDWSADGLHQAELLLDSALKIRPESANAKILMGYVYTHQKRYPEAQKLFADAARSSPPNTWLWTNWGESLRLQGKLDEAAAKYREALARPDNHDASTRARHDAYRNLLEILAARKDWDGMEALYSQHEKDGSREACVTVGYAQFMLEKRGNAQRAIEIARGIPDVDCNGASSRRVIGIASYLLWDQARDADGLDALNQARIYFPASARTLYFLASMDRTVSAARKLLATGESIDQKDSERMTALGYAVRAHDAVTAGTLIRLGAHADAPVGRDDMPVALRPVFEGDVEMVRALRRAGVDYSKIRFRGTTAIEFAQRNADEQLLQALTGKPSPL